MNMQRRIDMKKGYGMAHIGIYVKDMDISRAFYENVLGFERDFETDPAKMIHLLFLKTGDLTVELIEQPNKVRTDGPVDHICIKVDDIEAAVANLKENGIEPEGEIRVMPGIYNGIKNVFFRGPDGERLEFNEFL